jgi:hypothetical protein
MSQMNGKALIMNIKASQYLQAALFDDIGNNYIGDALGSCKRNEPKWMILENINKAMIEPAIRNEDAKLFLIRAIECLNSDETADPQ